MRAIFGLFLASFAFGFSAYGQTTTVTTDPVGFVTTQCLGASDTSISLPLSRPAEFVGPVSAINGNTVSVSLSGTNWTANQWTYGNGPNPANTYAAVITSGSMEGRYYTVTSSGSNSLVLNSSGAGTVQSQGVVVGDTFKLVPFWTLNTAFLNGAGIHISPDPFNPQSTVLTTSPGTSGVNIPLSTAYFYYNGSIGGSAGWYIEANLNAGVQNDAVLLPDEYYVIRNSAGATTNVTIAGNVPMNKFRTVLQVLNASKQQDNFVGVSFPVDLTLAQTGLQSSPAFTVSPDPFNPKDVLILYDNTTQAINKPLSTSYFYYDGSIGGSAGWYIESNLGAGTQDSTSAIKAGQGFVIRKAAGPVSSNFWVINRPY